MNTMKNTTHNSQNIQSREYPAVSSLAAHAMRIRRREMNLAFRELMAWISHHESTSDSPVHDEFFETDLSFEGIPFSPEQFEKDLNYFSGIFANELNLPPNHSKITCLVEEFLANYYRSSLPQPSPVHKPRRLKSLF